MFRNFKKFVEVAFENLQGSEPTIINIKQSIAENATSDGGISTNNNTQIVKVPDEESKSKNILLDSIETEIKQFLTLLQRDLGTTYHGIHYPMLSRDRTRRGRSSLSQEQ